MRRILLSFATVASALSLATFTVAASPNHEAPALADATSTPSATVTGNVSEEACISGASVGATGTPMATATATATVTGTMTALVSADEEGEDAEGAEGEPPDNHGQDVKDAIEQFRADCVTGRDFGDAVSGVAGDQGEEQPQRTEHARNPDATATPTATVAATATPAATVAATATAGATIQANTTESVSTDEEQESEHDSARGESTHSDGGNSGRGQRP